MPHASLLSWNPLEGSHARFRSLPDLRGRVPIHVGSQFTIQGEKAGEEFHTLIQSELSQHLHFAQVQPANGNSANPVNNFLAGVPSFGYRNNLTNLTTLSPSSISNVGGSQPHENRQPFLVVNFVIALSGTFPSRN